MSPLSLRLPEELELRLEEEAHREGLPRSEVARQAISDFLARREKERFMAELVAEAGAAYADETIRREAKEMAEEFIASDNEALDTAEGHKPGSSRPTKSGGRWWK